MQATRSTNPTETKMVALYYALALADLILACGALSLGGLKGRFAALAIIFPLFYMNHVVDGVPFPPVVPVVACNVVVLALNVAEALAGGSLGKMSYVAMQAGFGMLFLTEAGDLVRDPFVFATQGTDAMYVGQKLGFAVGMILTMHAAMALMSPPVGCIAAMSIVLGGMAKMSMSDGLPLGSAPLGAAGVCTGLCLVDYFLYGAGGSTGQMMPGKMPDDKAGKTK